MFKKFLLSKLPFPWLNLIRMVRGNVIKVFVIVIPSYLLNEKYVFMSKLNTVRLIKFHYLNFSSFLVYILYLKNEKC